jgi:hypothetical protein
MNKYEEALNNIRDLEIGYNLETHRHEKLFEDINYKILQECVDKATPKKPIILGPEDFALFECPTCHDKTHCGDFSHCSECGQAIDWSSDD